MTQRDFVNGALVTAGSLLAPAMCPVEDEDLGWPWTGPGGGGDYRYSSGNTHEVVNAAHAALQGKQSILSSAIGGRRASERTAAALG
jgi:spermidine dehydrogenase